MQGHSANLEPDCSTIGNARSILSIFIRRAEKIDDIVRKARSIGLTSLEIQRSRLCYRRAMDN